MMPAPPNYKLKDVDRVAPKHRAFRCRACRKDLDTTHNPTPKRFCAYCGCGEWEQIRSLTLKEAYRLYAETGVVFLNEDKTKHQNVKAFLTKHRVIVKCLDWLQKKRLLMRWPCVLSMKLLGEE